MTRRRSIRLATIGVSLLASACFAYVALRDVDWSRTGDALASSNYWWVVPAVTALAVSVAMRIERWRILFRHDERPGFEPLTKAMLVGLFFNIVLPARAGEAVRVVALRRYAGTSAVESSATVVVERLIDVLSLLALLFAVTPWLPPVTWLRTAEIVAVVGGVAAVGLVGVSVYLGNSGTARVVRALARLPLASEQAVEHGLASMTHGLAALTKPKQALVALAWTFASWLVLAAGFWFLMLGFDLHLSVLAGLLAVVATGLAFIVPSAPGSAGVFEAAGLAATSVYGVPTSRALAYVLVLHGLNVIPYLVAGALILIFGTSKARPEGSRVTGRIEDASSIRGRERVHR